VEAFKVGDLVKKDLDGPIGILVKAENVTVSVPPWALVGKDEEADHESVEYDRWLVLSETGHRERWSEDGFILIQSR